MQTDPLETGFLNKVFFFGIGVSAVVGACFLPGGRTDLALGVLTGALWMFVNVFFLFRLIAIAAGQTGGKRKKVLWICLVKFPGLYLAGYFILTGRYFPPMGILTGITVFMAALSAAWIRFQFFPALRKEGA